MDALFRILIAFIVVMVVTILVTTLICRYRLARKKRVSYGTVILGACLASTLSFFSDLLGSAGWKLFTMAFWTSPMLLVGDMLKFWALLVCLCVLPAFGVVGFYQRLSKKSKAHMA
jgi:hypothetical protein